MELYKEYLEELRPGSLVFETKYGFIHHWTTTDQGIWIESFYIAKHKRGTEYYRLMLDSLRTMYPNSTHLMCHVDSTAKDPTKRILAYSRYGFNIVGTKGNHILMYKSLDDKKTSS